MAAEDQELTDDERLLLDVLTSSAACVSLLCALYMIISILRSRYYRSRIYHRMVFGCSLTLILDAAEELWGSAAAPEGTLPGSRGTQATCSTQGFLYHISIFAVPTYYVVQSLVSYASLRFKRTESDFRRIEFGPKARS